MSIVTLTNKHWRRLHDAKAAIARRNVARITCFDTLKDLIKICATSPRARKLKGSGSHWGLSTAALSDGEAIETNWPGSEIVPRHSGFDLDLDNLYSEPLFRFLVANPPPRAEVAARNPCLEWGATGPFYVHMKSGTRIYEAYSMLDQIGAESGPFAARLNAALGGTPDAGAYKGPWAFATLGGAGGQTVFGALTTGTHGGDYKQQPISDSVAAVHLVTAGGSHYWIEPTGDRGPIPIADDEKLRSQYGAISVRIGGRPTRMPFSIIRDNDVFDSVVVSAGRFGVIASVVLRVVPQYCLHGHRVLEDWSEVKRLLQTPVPPGTPERHHFFDTVYFPAEGRAAAQNEFTRRFLAFEPVKNRFLQIAVNVCPHGMDEHRCGITQRWFARHDSPEAKNPDGSMRGRPERGIPEVAGKTFPYEPSGDPAKSGSWSGTFLQKACSSGNFIAGVLRQTANEIQGIIDDGIIPSGGVAAAALIIGGGAAVLAIASICLILAAIVLILNEIADAVEASGDVTLTQVVDEVVVAS